MSSTNYKNRCAYCAGAFAQTHRMTVSVGNGETIDVHSLECAVGWLVEKREELERERDEARALAVSYAEATRRLEGDVDWRERGHPRSKLPWEAPDA